MQPRVIAWRRDLHQNPELSNREFRTSKVVADSRAQPRLAAQALAAVAIDYLTSAAPR